MILNIQLLIGLEVLKPRYVWARPKGIPFERKC